MADPEVWNRGVAIGEGEQNLERGLSPPPKFFGKFDSKIMHFCAKFSLVLRYIWSIGGAPPLKSATGGGQGCRENSINGLGG